MYLLMLTQTNMHVLELVLGDQGVSHRLASYVLSYEIYIGTLGAIFQRTKA